MRMVLMVIFSALLFSSCTVADVCEDEPAYAGDATDETWVVMKDNEKNAKSGDQAAVFTAPENGAHLSADSSPTFSWTSPLKTASFAPGAQEWRRSSRFAYPLKQTWLDGIFSLVLPAVHAHKPPITSDLYWLQFVLPGEQCVASVLTTELEVILDDETWNLLRETEGKKIEARLLSGYVEQNILTEGPFVAEKIVFSVD